MTGHLLMLMGSGETAPTMVRPHREVFTRLGPDPVTAVVLDTPYGFQENAAAISARTVQYFADSVGREVGVAGLTRVAGADPVTVEAAMGRVAAATWVFAGPGSPTYALRQWRGSDVPALLGDKLQHGGCVVFASAAALTLGRWTVPVYEIYKVGAEPRWEDGLGLLGPIGLPVAVIPHYDNAEGGGHDTRFCYLGERRLRMLEEQLPEDAWVLGVDEHTALLIDLDAGEGTVMGNGGVTVRNRGRSTVVESGRTVPLDQLSDMAAGRPVHGEAAGAPPGQSGSPPPSRPSEAPPAATPLAGDIRRLEAEFTSAVAVGDVESAVRAVLQLDEALAAWATDTNQSDDFDRGRAALRRMVVRLGELAQMGARDPAETVGPFVNALLAERAAARRDRRYADADRVRDALGALGIEVRDTPAGTEWVLGGVRPALPSASHAPIV
jgi:hypothetical protein